MADQRSHVAGFTVCGKDQGIIYAQISNLPVAQSIKIFRCLLAGKKVVIIDIDRIIGVLRRFSDQDIEKSLTEKKINNRIIHTGIKNDKSVNLTASGHGTYCSQDLFFILTGNNGADILMCVTVVADPPDRLKVKGILVCLLWGRRQDDTDGAGNLCCQVTGLKIRLIAKLRHGSAYTFLGFFTDRWIIFAGSGNGGRGHPGQSCHIFDGYCHKFASSRICRIKAMHLIRLFLSQSDRDIVVHNKDTVKHIARKVA